LHRRSRTRSTSAVSDYELTISIAHKGKGVYLIKRSSRRKRTRREMEEVKQEEDLLKNNKLGFLHAAKRMKMEIQQYRQRDNLPEDYEQIVDALPNLDMLLDEQRLMM